MTRDDGALGGTKPRHVLRYERGKDGGVVTGTPQLALPLNVTDDGEVRLYRMVLPYLPPSKNVYANWPAQWKSSAKAKWVRDIGIEVEAQMMPKGLFTVGLAATLIFPSKNRRDPQNYAEALWHWVPDALVTSGLLVDDREGAVQIGGNWGLKFAYDTRNVNKKWRSKTVLNLAMRVH